MLDLYQSNAIKTPLKYWFNNKKSCKHSCALFLADAQEEPAQAVFGCKIVEDLKK